jgi:hypothetical protein
VKYNRLDPALLILVVHSKSPILILERPPRAGMLSSTANSFPLMR